MVAGFVRATLAVVSAAVLAACGGGGASGPSEPAGVDDPVTLPSGAAEPTAEPGPVTLSDLLGIGGAPEEVAREIRSSETARQELVRDCMAEQGFEYVPHVTAGELVDPTGLPSGLPEAEFRRQYGYGITTGFENALGLEPEESVEDPNIAIVEAMSEQERAAYTQARYGTESDQGDGCEGEATAATDRHARVAEEFGDEIADMWARVDADSRVVGAQRDWSDCLARAGYPFPDEAAIQAEINRRMNPVYEAILGEEIPDEMSIVVRDRTLTAEQSGLLAETRGFELAVANADQDCRDEVGLDRIREEVRDEYEARFVDEHRGRLAELFPDAGL